MVIHLIERTLLAVQVGEACSADGMGACQIDGWAVLGIKFMTADGTRQKFGPLRRLDGHSQQEIILSQPRSLA